MADAVNRDSPPLQRCLAALRAAAEPSRLRLLAICAHGEWTVSELVQIMGQSQPRISRHLKVLAEAGLLERFREGSWVFYRRSRDAEGARFVRALCRLLPEDDPDLARDRARLAGVREARRREVEAYFASRAVAWDSERDLGVDGARVEEVLRELFARERPARLLDIGTGTGRVLQLLAPLVETGIGVDINPEMLRVARVRLDRRELGNCSVRQADMYRLPFPDGAFEAAVFHQVLHFAEDPAAALAEAARVLAPGGRLVVVDLASHDREWLRVEKRHRRLGFSDEEMRRWFAEFGLSAERATKLRGEELTVVIWVARRIPVGSGTLEPQRERQVA